MRTPPPFACLLLKHLRETRGLTQPELAERTGFHLRTVQRNESEVPANPEEMAVYLRVLVYDPEDRALLLQILVRAQDPAPGPRSPVDPTPAERRILRRLANRNLYATLDAADAHFLRFFRAWHAFRARREAVELCTILIAEPAERRRVMIENVRRLQRWDVAERLCELSTRAAADKASVALELADLGVRVAELSPGDDLWRARLLGYCLAFLANAQRVGGHQRLADETFTRALELWGQGKPADWGLLAAWRLLDLEASLRKDQRRFAVALERLEQAWAAAPREARGRILLNKASTLEQMEEPESALEALRRAGPLLDEKREPRNVWVQRFNLGTCLCGLGQYREAEDLLEDVQRLAEALRQELDLVRCLWLRAKVHAGLGRSDEARAAYEQVRKAFEDREIPFDGALVTLDLALLLLEQRCTPEVRRLALGMAWIFKAEGMQEHALAALAVFHRAALQEAATVELTRQVQKFLERARHDPELRFEAPSS